MLIPSVSLDVFVFSDLSDSFHFFILWICCWCLMRVGVSLAVWHSLCCFDFCCFLFLISSDRFEFFLPFYDFSGFARSLVFCFSISLYVFEFVGCCFGSYDLFEFVELVVGTLMGF